MRVESRESRVGRRLEAFFLPALAALVLLAAWHAAVAVSGTDVFPTPAAVAAGVEDLLRRGVLGRYVADSLFRVASGYLIAVSAGVPLGILLGWYPGAARALNPLIQTLRPISPIAWIPVAIVLFGVSNFATIFLIFLGSFFPIVVASSNGVRNIPAMYLAAGRNFGLVPAALFARVVFPAALPHILTGLRIALGVAWLVV